MTDAALYHGIVTHRRLRPKVHSLAYRVFSMLIDLDAASAVADRLRWFSRGRFNLFSFHDRDHGAGFPADLAAYMRATLREAGVAADGPIRLLCYPRMLGYAFNPLAVYYCSDAQDRLVAVVYEVSNTFGERHAYLIPVDADAAVIRQAADKRLHVSPFMEMETRYHFRLNRPGETLSLLIRQTDAAGPVLHAGFTGVREEMTDAALVRAFRRYPLMTVKVIAGIHLEAAKLLAKGLKLRAGPPAPAAPVSVIR